MNKTIRIKNNFDNNTNEFYKKENIWIISLKVVLPSLLLTLLFGIYIFIDQLLIINLIPNDNINYYQNYFIKTNNLHLLNEVQMIYDKLLNNNIAIENIGFTIFDNKNFINYAASQIGVFSLIVLSFGYLISAGSSILYSHSYALKNEERKKQVFQSSFYGTLLFSIISITLMILIQKPILQSILPNTTYNPTNEVINSGLLTQSDYDLISLYKTTYYNGAIEQSQNYLYFLNASIGFSCFANLFVFYLRAEGKNLWITIIGVCSNISNILLDVLFIEIKLGMLGSGMATFFGMLFNMLGLLIYVLYLIKHKKTSISFVSLKKFNINIKILFISICLGSGNFLRELSLAIANIIYLQVFYSTFASITNGLQAADIITKIVASPIYNLFFFSIFGIIDGLRPIISYNYALKNYKRVKDAFWVGITLGTIYTILVNIIVFSSLTNSFILNFFLPVSPNEFDLGYKILIILLMSMMFQLPFIALSVGGLSIFQSTGKIFMNFILSLMQGTITFYPVLFSMSAISKSLDNYNIMIFTGLTNIIISSIIIFTSAILYLYIYMGKKENNNDPNESINKSIESISNIFNNKLKICK